MTTEETVRRIFAHIPRFQLGTYSSVAEVFARIVRESPRLKDMAEEAMLAAFPDRKPMLQRHIELLEIGEQLDKDLKDDDAGGITCSS